MYPTFLKDLHTFPSLASGADDGVPYVDLLQTKNFLEHDQTLHNFPRFFHL